MPEDALNCYVQQSSSVDLDQYVVPLGRKEHDYPDSRELVSVVVEVSKEELLESLEPESQLELLPMLELEHDEDVGAWATIVREWMVSAGVDGVNISEVVDATNLPTVKVWIAALLSNFELEQTKDFYSFDGLVLSVVLVFSTRLLNSMVALFFQNKESNIQEISDALAKLGIPSETSTIYAKGILAVKDDFERLPQSNGLLLMKSLVKIAQNNPNNPLEVLECFQEKLQELLAELDSCEVA
jgi:hypothetical protein